ncbi:hypothetical protein ACJVDH_19720 [Pedobacter sp. AW1-32]|uniref:hypothetical protein n=1 Tax=Pedobacter sp. AW1-32 TaxID=3383026 RepID=UPI003FEF861F
MKTLSIFILLLAHINGAEDPSTVYICNSGKAKKYHYTQNCRGLSNCQSKIIKTTIEQAKKDDKTLCGWEK